jgi:hypothetical protein
MILRSPAQEGPGSGPARGTVFVPPSWDTDGIIMSQHV